MAERVKRKLQVETPRRGTFGSALKWSYVMQGGRQAATTVITLLLAGLLGPAAFGTVAMATVYIMFVQMILQQGMVPALIQRQNLKSQHLDSAFWMITATGLILTALSVMLSGWWASVNRLPDLQAVIVALSLLIPMKSLVLVQEGILRREMDFRTLAVRTNISVIVGGAVGVAMAVEGFGIWSLVAQQLTTGLVELVVIWSISSWRPGITFSIDCAKELFGFSGPSSLASFGTFINNRSDALLIGLFFGPIAVGLYRFASRLVDMLIDTAVRSLQAVSLPELSRLQDDRAAFSERLRALVRLSSLLALPALGILSASSDPLTAVVGSEWTEAAVPLKILSFVGGVRAITFFNGPMLQAIGRPQILAVLSWGAAVLSGGAFVVAGLLLSGASTTGQVFGISLSRAMLYGFVFLSINVVVLIRMTKLSLPKLATAVAPAAAAALAAMAAGEMVQAMWFASELSALAMLLATVVGGALASAIVLVVTDPALRATIFNRRRRVTTAAPEDNQTVAEAAPV